MKACASFVYTSGLAYFFENSLFDQPISVKAFGQRKCPWHTLQSQGMLAKNMVPPYSSKTKVELC